MRCFLLFTPLRQRPYRVLFSAQVCSDLANWLDFLALNALIVYHWGLGAEALAALYITMGIPWVFIGPIASVWTHRLPAKSLMMVCDLLRMVIVFGFIWAPNLYLLLILVFLKGVCSSIFDPVRQTSIRHVVHDEHLAQASSLSQLSVNLTKIIAPSLGGILLALSGPQMAFITGSVLYGLSSLALIMLPPIPSTQADPSAKSSFTQEFTQGLRYIKQHRPLFLGVLFMSIALFLIFLYDGLLPLFISSIGIGEEGLGWLMSAVGLGSVLGSLAAGHWVTWKKDPLSYMSKAGILSGVLFIFVGLGGLKYFFIPLIIWLGIFFFIGFFGARASVPFGYILQSQTPKDLIGRVSAATQAVHNATLLIAPAIGAGMAKLVGVGGVLSLVGVFMSFLSVLFIHFNKSTLDKKENINSHQVEAS